jgi:hypothetical protein
MQNVEASVTVLVPPGVRGPAGTPVSVYDRHCSSWKQPAFPDGLLAGLFAWFVQKMPSGAVAVTAAVLSGERFTGMVPT